jgi:Penicillinase repressor
MERGIERALLHLHDIARNLLEPLRDGVPVDGPQGDNLQDEHVERPLRQISLGMGHGLYLLFDLKNRASVEDIRERLTHPPTYSAVRAMLSKLEGKGHVRHQQDGVRYIYERTQYAQQLVELARRLSALRCGRSFRWVRPMCMLPTSARMVLARKPVVMEVEMSDYVRPRVLAVSGLLADGTVTREIDTARFQMLLFTLITAAFVLMNVVTTYVIPEISTGFQTLMGISNGVYLGSKIAQGS